jgi:hypothetical protein
MRGARVGIPVPRQTPRLTALAGIAQLNANHQLAQPNFNSLNLGQAGYEITDGRTVVPVDLVISIIKRGRETKPAALDMAREHSSSMTPNTEGIDTGINRAETHMVTKVIANYRIVTSDQT